MQLMPATAEFVGVEDPFHAEQNVRGGSRYLAHLFSRYGDWSRTLAAYNAGPEAVDRHGGIPPYAETREYVDRVLAYYRRYDAEFDR
jgi:soluble lytic murein transglycosylase-like protein